MGTDQENVSTDVGTRLLFENDQVRVWEMLLGPGERSHVHRHLDDHLLIYVDDSTMRGNLEGSEDQVVVDVEADFVMHRIVGEHGTEPHYLENVGTEPSKHYVIEMVGRSAATEPQPPTYNDRGRFEFPETGSSGY